MGIKIKIDRTTRRVLLENHGQKLIANGIRQGFDQIGKLIKKETKEGIKRPPKTGRYYKYKGRRKRASINIKEAEYPANRSGDLRKSINFKVQGRERLIIGASARYAEYLEEGTGKMEARKLLGFTIEKNQNKIRAIFRKNVNAEIKR